MFIDAMKRLLSMGLPLATTRLIQTINMFIAMAVLAQLGHTALSASLLIATIRPVIIVIFMAPLFMMGPIISRQFTSGDKESILDIFQQSWLTVLLLSILPVALLFFVEPLLKLAHQPSNVIPYVGQYYEYAKWTFPMILLGTACSQVLAPIKKQNLLAISSFLYLIVSATLCYGMTLGHFGFPKMGATGAGIASLISSTFYILLLVYLTIKHTRVFGHFWQWRMATLNWTKMTFKMGTPIGLQFGSQMLSYLFLNIMVGWIGLTAMAAGQISNEYMLFAVTAVFGVAEAASILVGHAYGEKKWTQIPKLFRHLRQLGNHGVPVAALFAFTLGWGVIGMCIAACFTRAISLCVMSIRWRVMTNRLEA